MIHLKETLSKEASHVPPPPPPPPTPSRSWVNKKRLSVVFQLFNGLVFIIYIYQVINLFMVWFVENIYIYLSQPFYGLVCWEYTCINQHLKAANMSQWLWALSCCVYVCVSASVTSWTRSVRGTEVYIMQWANLFLLFISREWTNMAAPWGAQIWSKSILLLALHECW